MAVVGPWHIDIPAWSKPYSTVGTWTNTNYTGSLGMNYTITGGSQNDEITWQVPLLAGTWTLTLIHFGGTNRGIYTVSLDGTSVGTIDGYGSGVNAVGQIAGISVATDAVYTLKLKMATKNASSSGYYAVINQVTMSRTA